MHWCVLSKIQLTRPRQNSTSLRCGRSKKVSFPSLSVFKSHFDSLKRANKLTIIYLRDATDNCHCISVNYINNLHKRWSTTDKLMSVWYFPSSVSSRPRACVNYRFARLVSGVCWTTKYARSGTREIVECKKFFDDHVDIEYGGIPPGFSYGYSCSMLGFFLIILYFICFFVFKNSSLNGGPTYRWNLGLWIVDYLHPFQIT